MRKPNLFFKILLASILLLSLVVNVSAQQVGDVNCDNVVNIIDALVIAQYSVGLVSTLGCGPGVVTPTPIVVIPPTPTTPPIVTGPHVRVNNPFVGAKWYVNPDWVENTRTSAGSKLANVNTAVWMDRIGAITAGRGLVGHLDEALKQGANLIIVVIYDLPGRDCAASASNGELPNTAEGMARYKNEYIDPIKAIFENPKYNSLRIVCIIEPDSLPNLVTNLNIQNCSQVNQTGAYVEGTRYAIGQLDKLNNTYQYIDIAHSGWLGWDSNLGPAAAKLAEVVLGAPKGLNGIAGFVSNTANYTPSQEIYLPNPSLNLNGMPIRSADFYEWNDYFDEISYNKAMKNLFVQRGLPSSIGMLIDTSRNGWGGSNRPSRTSSSNDINTYVNESRLDRREHRGNWCNQGGAGLGVRPVANPVSGIDAYVWIKPPGEADGVSKEGIVDPTDTAKQFDEMCGPNNQNRDAPQYGTGAIDSPHAGRWNETHFQQLVKNAYPSL